MPGRQLASRRERVLDDAHRLRDSAVPEFGLQQPLGKKLAVEEKKGIRTLLHPAKPPSILSVSSDNSLEPSVLKYVRYRSLLNDHGLNTIMLKSEIPLSVIIVVPATLPG